MRDAVIVDAVRNDPPAWLVARDARPIELGAQPAAQP